MRERRFTSTYHDTRDMRLAAAGITLRHRSEEGSGLWQLKLPHEKGRLELELVGNAKAPPPSIRDLITGVIGRRALLPVATLETQAARAAGARRRRPARRRRDGRGHRRRRQRRAAAVRGARGGADRRRPGGARPDPAGPARRGGSRDRRPAQAVPGARARAHRAGRRAPRGNAAANTWRRCSSHRSGRSSPTTRVRGWAPIRRTCTSTAWPSAGCGRCSGPPSRCSTRPGPRAFAASCRGSAAHWEPSATWTCCWSTCERSARSWASRTRSRSSG